MGVPKCCGQQSCNENDPPMTNDRRCQLINQVKELIGSIEKEDKMKPKPSKRPDRPVPTGMRDMEDECASYNKRYECERPLITAIALHETRPTSDYSNMRHENSSMVTYVDATLEDKQGRKVPPAPWDLPRKPSQELRAGTLHNNCRCLKRDGLQHDCPRWECGGRPECVAINPGPCCEPSKWPKPIRGERRYGNRITQEEPRNGITGQFSMKELKTGPMNPEICIPMQGGSPHQTSPHQGSPHQGSPHQASPHQASPHQGSPHHMSPHQASPHHMSPHHAGGMGLMVLDLGGSGGFSPESRQHHPHQGQGMTLSGGGMTCQCSPM